MDYIWTVYGLLVDYVCLDCVRTMQGLCMDYLCMDYS